MKKFLYIAVAAIAALSSCSSDTDLLSEVAGNGAKVFTARFEGTNSRVTLNGMTPNWEADDVISINGAEYKAKTAGATSEFEATGAEAEGNTYTAYFPTSIYNGGTPTLPELQTYTAGKFGMPMYAESTTRNLEFKNLCAVLAVKVTSDDIATLKSIKVKANKALCGTFSISENKAVLTDASDNTKSVVLSSESALTLDETGTTFYIVIPAQDYAYLNIYLSADGTTYTQAMATKQAAGLGAIARNTIFYIDYEKNAVKLWNGNVFFADRNVGAATATDYGGYYAWGGNVDLADATGPLPYYNSGADPLSGDDDTATFLWGSNWRMPTKDDLDQLNKSANCIYAWITVNGVEGSKFTGRVEPYTSNSIFLPAAGRYFVGDSSLQQNQFCNYWSSTPTDDGRTWIFHDSSGRYVTRNPRNNVAFSVRAVLVE